MFNMDSEIGYFTRDTIIDIKYLIKQRWRDGNPICVDIPLEDIIPYLRYIVENETKI